MQQRRYLNPSQPQTLQIAVMLLYLNAAFGILTILLVGAFWWVIGIMIGQAAAGYGIANERKWAYALGIVVSVLPFGLRFFYTGNPFSGTNVINLMFEVALVALLLHPQSRDYQRIWFK